MNKVKLALWLTGGIAVISISFAWYLYHSMKVVNDGYISLLEGIALFNIMHVIGINKSSDGPFEDIYGNLSEKQTNFVNDMLEFNTSFVDFSSSEIVIEHRLKTKIICKISTLKAKGLDVVLPQEIDSLIHNDEIVSQCALMESFIGRP